MKYTIDRSIWVCGIDYRRGSVAAMVKKMGSSQLLNSKRRMCCLGQICSIHGIRDDDLHHMDSPTYLNDGYRKKNLQLPTTIDWLLNQYMGDSDIATEMMTANDCDNITQEQREAKLIELAASVGHELEFVGELGV